MGSDGHEEGIKGVDLECGLRLVGVCSIKTKPLHFSGPLLLSKYRERCVVSGVSVVITRTENQST